MNKFLLLLLTSTLFFASCKRQQINTSANIPSPDSVNVSVFTPPVIVNDSSNLATSNNPIKVG